MLPICALKTDYRNKSVSFFETGKIRFRVTVSLTATLTPHRREGKAEIAEPDHF